MSLHGDQEQIVPGVILEYAKFARNSYGVWLIQGSVDYPTEFFIPEWELEAHIAALKKANDVLKNRRKGE